MGFPKEAMAWMGKNLRVAKDFAARNPKTVGSIARWGMWGAGLGAVRGAYDDITGRGNEGILGGAIQGATTLGGLRAMKIGLNKGMSMAKGNASKAARGAARGRAKAGMRGPKGSGQWTSGAGI
jgi:hypothetical protein